MEPSERSSKVVMGFIFLGVVCFFNTVPLLAVSILANLTAVSTVVELSYRIELTFIRPVRYSSRYTYRFWTSGRVPGNGESGTLILFRTIEIGWLSGLMGHQDLLNRLRYPAADHLGIVRFLPAHHHEAIDQVSGRHHSIASGSSRHGAVLCVLDHLQLFDLFPLWCGLE